MNYPNDIVIECPFCHTRTMKQIDLPEFLRNMDKNLLPYGCYTCGHIAIFDQKFLEEYLCKLLKADYYPQT